MKKIFRKNQIIITALALMIAVAGYINYSDNIRNRNKNNKTSTENETADIVSNDLDDPGATVFTSSVNSQFIISAKLEREQVRASGKETLLEVINNTEISEEAKAQAISDMVAIADASEKEAAAELLLEAKGFENVIVSMSNGQVDVVVETAELTDTNRAQIEDIVTRKTGCSIENLTITSITPAKDNTAAVSADSETESESAGEEQTVEEPSQTVADDDGILQ